MTKLTKNDLLRANADLGNSNDALLLELRKLRAEKRATPADPISQARNAVIEECAKVCDDAASRLSTGPGYAAAMVLAANIRALTTQSGVLD